MKFETQLKETLPRTSDSTSFRFPRPVDFIYRPGQYMLVTIRAGDKELTHPFSFSSSPTEADYVEFTKKFTQNEYSTALKAMKPGDWARIDAPYGKFTFEGEYPKVGLLTGGIGITPFRSICKYCTDKRLEASIVLLYGCRNPNEIPFRNEFEVMQKQNKNLKVVLTVNEPNNEWRGYTGNITAEMVRKEMPDFGERVLYACGPPGMVQAMTNLVKELGLPETSLKLEYFAGHT
ncbi:MAG: ferredoxin--NADP reductase [Candidatus Bathyarchaeia archaeon]